MRLDLEDVADESMDQHFLTNPQKLSLILDAAHVQPDDVVVELGAGAGTVSSALPPVASLTLVELDPRLCQILRREFPSARVIQGDAVSFFRGMVCDVLLCNLPTVITDELIAELDAAMFRVAVLATGEEVTPDDFPRSVEVTKLGDITGHDFTPPQVERSQLFLARSCGRSAMAQPN